MYKQIKKSQACLCTLTGCIGTLSDREPCLCSLAGCIGTLSDRKPFSRDDAYVWLC